MAEDWKSFPFLTATIAGVILAVAHYVTGWVPTAESLRPVAFSRAAWEAGDYHTILTSLFAHAGIIHLVGNLLTLIALGPIFERQLGRPKFLLAYFGAGLVGNLAHITFEPNIPIVGASGCLFGLLGLLVILDPGAWMNLIGVPIPIVLFAGLYTAAAPLLISFSKVVPIAHEAHLGGMFLGALLAFAFNPKRSFRFAPGILVVFLGSQLLLTKLLTFDWSGAAERAEKWIDFLPAVLVLVAGGVYIGWTYSQLRREMPVAQT